jgi:hypothetical protein
MLFPIMFSTVIHTSAFNWPYQVDFKIQYYNNSFCHTDTKNTSIPLFCIDTELINGIPRCCNKLLDNVKIQNYSQFNTCYNYLTNQSLEYTCKHNNTMNNQQIWALMGIVFGCMWGLFFIIVIILSLRKKSESIKIDYSHL